MANAPRSAIEDRRSRLRSQVGVCAGATVLVALAVIVISSGGEARHAVRHESQTTRSGIIVIDAASHKIDSQVAFKQIAAGGVIGFGSRWINTPQGLIELDPATGETKHVIPITGGAYAVVIAAGKLWVSGNVREDEAVYGIDPRTRDIVVRTSVPGTWGNLYAGGGYLWLTGEQRLTRVDARTGKLAGYVALHPFQRMNNAFLMAFGFGSAWIVDPNKHLPGPFGRGALYRIDPRTGHIVARIAVPGESTYDEVVTGAGSVWVASGEDGLLWRVDPDSNVPTLLRNQIEGGIDAMTVAANSLWISTSGRELVQLALGSRHRRSQIWHYTLPRHPQSIVSNKDGKILVTYGHDEPRGQ